MQTELQILEVSKERYLNQDVFYFSFGVLLIQHEYVTSLMRENFQLVEGDQGFPFGTLLSWKMKEDKPLLGRKGDHGAWVYLWECHLSTA